MDYKDIQEVQRTLQRHKESIQCNGTSLFSVTSKVHKNKHQCATQNVTIINHLVQQRQKLDVLEAKCSMLKNLVINLNKDSHSTTSNHRMSINSAHVGYEETASSER